jgi:hypothetical protein
MPPVDKKSIQPLYRNLELAACDLFSRETDEGTAFVRLERYRKAKRELKAHPQFSQAEYDRIILQAANLE